MLLYQIQAEGKLKEVFEKPFKLEREIQRMVENNLQSIFGLELVKSEFSIGNYRLDTLAFDPQATAFVIIEYKRAESFSVVDQGYAYLSVMLNNKGEFILEANERQGKTLKRSDVDWSQSRILFVSPAFTSYQRDSINFKDLPIELWEVGQYENDLIYFNQIKSPGATASIKTISAKSQAIERVNSEVKVYTEPDHLSDAQEEIKELYHRFKEAILSIGDNISIKVTPRYISFVGQKKRIVDVHIGKKKLKFWIAMKPGELDDPKGVSKNNWIHAYDDENLEYIVSLIRQSYRKA